MSYLASRLKFWSFVAILETWVTLKLPAFPSSRRFVYRVHYTFLICSRIHCKLVDYNNEVILTGRLGTETPVVNTKWPWHSSNLPWIPGSPFTVHTCISAESCLKECFYRPFYRASRKTIVSNTKNIEICYRHARLQTRKV